MWMPSFKRLIGEYFNQKILKQFYNIDDQLGIFMIFPDLVWLNSSTYYTFSHVENKSDKLIN